MRGVTITPSLSPRMTSPGAPALAAPDQRVDFNRLMRRQIGRRAQRYW
jgi:hypothetical protein